MILLGGRGGSEQTTGLVTGSAGNKAC